MPVPAHKHQIRLRAWIGLDRVQKDFGEYFYRETGGLVTSRRRGGWGIQGQVEVARFGRIGVR